MNFLITFAITIGLFGALSAGPQCFRRYFVEEEDVFFKRFIVKENGRCTLSVVDLKNEVATREATLDDVRYYLYTNDNADEPYIVKNGSQIEQFFDKTKQNMFIIHGWFNGYAAPVNQLIKAAVLDRYCNEFNVFVVDWSPIAYGGYVTAVTAVEDIGIFVGGFLNDVMRGYDLDGSRFILIGHSLGAHIAGVAAGVANSRIPHIIGLDPAGPLFSLSNTENRLDPGDADFVQVIHTCGRLLGLGSSIGHVDFYPNGGMSQPGCGADLTGSCSHSRSYELFAEGIRLQSDYEATLCDSYDNYLNEECLQNQRAIMGRFDLDTSLRGDFYLTTNPESPFAKN